ncbi:putative protein kinase RLK-Pelle-LRR-I-1 family [Helianthus annuus]|uniref:non-specific serine/threonine protein kinase n=1 Tax=Helianthus annuus TaxID=4232 RepID=A0A9K3HQK4_HELAN|nr:putative protein kinase RLK-Pelle-LRR-I-1 family [Helianthus annuus]KAJ0876025.1 putative protein kinase RLK-Pelle-LRR-I-1 family [Helianthus annuus]
MSHITQFQHLKIQLEAIRSATNNFSDDNCIGGGGFGKVYKGQLIHSRGETMVALKRLNRASMQGDPEFWKEILMLPLYPHENIVSLLGYCDEAGEKILVYEYAPRKSLDYYLASDNLTWIQRLKICIGAARGLEHLHTPTGTQLRIVHRDIKSSNILLDNNWNAKISDFGLSKFAPANNQFTFMISNPAGTLGYIDPLYHETGLLTKESDVYSFGVVLFEVLCGRLCFSNTNLHPLIGLVREYYEQNKISELVHSNLKDEIDVSSLEMFADIAYQCLRRERTERPLMRQVVGALEWSLVLQERADANPAVHRDGILTVKVLSITDLNNNPLDASKQYLVLEVSIGVYIQRKAKYYEANAKCNEEFTLYVNNLLEKDLYIYVNNIVSVNKHCHLGKSWMKLIDLTPEIPCTRKLPLSDVNDHQIGNLIVEVSYKPINIEDVISFVLKAPIGTPKDGGLLVIIIHGANLYETKGPLSVSLIFRGEVRKTKSMMNTNIPVWIQEFTFMLEQPPTDENVHFDVINDESMEPIGWVDVSLASVVNSKLTDVYYSLEPTYPVGEIAVTNLLHRWRCIGEPLLR